MRLGELEITGRTVLAPMAGVTDWAFRTVCAELGAAVTVTEMVSSRALVYQDKKSRGLLRKTPSGVCGAQIFGNDPAIMAEAAGIALELSGCDFIDINMGCPMPKIAGNGDGCALMQNVELAARIVEAVAAAVPVPVTVKMRKGWDKGSVNCAELLMIGRSAFGNPWVFAQVQAALDGREIPALPPLSERMDTAMRQFELAREDKGEHIACLEARKHLAWYLRGVPYSGYYKEKISSISTVEDVQRLAAGIRRDLR